MQNSYAFSMSIMIFGVLIAALSQIILKKQLCSNCYRLKKPQG